MGAQTIEIAPPSWRTAVAIYQAVLINGSEQGVAEASRELGRCAAIADGACALLAIVEAAIDRGERDGIGYVLDAAEAARARVVIQEMRRSAGTRSAVTF